MGRNFYTTSLETQVFTTGMVAEICRVTAHTVGRWFDAGVLAGHRIPSGNRGESGTDRRIMRRHLVAFMKKYDMPFDRLPGGEHGGGRVLAVGMSAAAIAELSAVRDGDGSLVQVVDVQSEFEAGVAVADFLPDVVVSNVAVVDQSFATRIRTVPGCEDIQIFAVAGEYAEEATVRRWQAAGFTRVATAVQEIATVVSDWRAIKQADMAKRNAPLASRKNLEGKRRGKSAQRVA